MSRCAPTSPGCACRASGRASSPWPRASIRGMSARGTSRCITSWPRRPWDAAAVLRVARDWVLDADGRHGPVAAWIVDDTAFPKKGRHSVGVARQYCGVLGKQDNCQVAVSVSVANEAVSLPVAYRLYLPESWAHGPAAAPGRRGAGRPRVPAQVADSPWRRSGRCRPRACRPAPVVADAGYGDTTAFREALTTAGLAYVVGREEGDDGVAARPGAAAAEAAGRAAARPPTLVRRTATPSARRASSSWPPNCPPTAWRTVTWREGHARGDALPLRPAPRPARPSR